MEAELHWIPGGINSLSHNISQTVTTPIITIVGMTAISTKIYVSNLIFYVYVPGSTLFFLVIFVKLFRGFNHIEENFLFGVGDVIFSMAVSICSCWLISVLFSYLLSVRQAED